MQVTRDAIAEWPALRSPVPAQSCRQGQSQDGNTTVTKGCENPSQQPKRQVQAEQPDEAEHKLPAGGTQGGERTRAGRTFRQAASRHSRDRPGTCLVWQKAERAAAVSARAVGKG